MAAFTSRSLFVPSTAPDLSDGVTFEVGEPFTLISLRDSPAGKKLMHQQDWYQKYDWAHEEIGAGAYRLRLPVPGSNAKTFAEQQALLQSGEVVAPVALVAAALLCIAQSGSPDPLKDGWIRCAEVTARGYRVALDWYGGRLHVDHDWSDVRSVNVWLASAGTSEPCLSSS